jgi:hypothetical protein
MLRHVLSASIGIAVVLPAAKALGANTLQVGPGKTYTKPCAAIAAAQTGDTIEVDAAGNYAGDTCAWTTDGLTIRGVNGRAKIDLTGVTPAQQKGIFTIGGNASATIESFELSGAAISAAAGNNGAGIRHQGLNLTVRDCYIHDNQDGILAAPATANTGAILVESSEFSHNGAGDGYSHNMYIGDFASFTLQFSYSHDGNVGHLFKSRAFVTSVLYDRITDEAGGTASYEVDIPNGGTAYVIGNIIEQSASTQNPTILTFGEEGTPVGYDTHLFVVNNTFINDLGHGTFVADTTSTPAVIENNVFYEGTISGQAGATLTTNFDGTAGANPMFTNVASYDVSLQQGSACIDKGTTPGSNGSQSLVPLYEYVHPLSGVPRTVVGSAIDIGAYEYGLAEDAGVIGPDAAPPDAGGTASGSGSGSSGSGSGSAASSGSGSGASSGGGSSSGGDGGANGAAGSGGGGGCGCVLAGSEPGGTVLGLGATAAFVWTLGRRRRSRAGHGDPT